MAFKPSVSSCVNPTATVEDLAYMLESTKSAMLIVHPVCIATALEAARVTGIPRSRIVLLGTSPDTNMDTVDQLVEQGLERVASFEERRLAKGEAKEKVALVSFSSGTTGKPKVCLFEGGLQVISKRDVSGY